METNWGSGETTGLGINKKICGRDKMGKSKWWTWTRSWWTPQVVFCTVIIIILTAIILWDYIPHEKVILYTALAFFALGLGYVLRHLPRTPTTITLWRGLFIFLGASGIGFVLWAISVIVLRRVFGLGADPAALTSLPVYLLGALLGGYLGNKLGKRVGMP